jgi:hypothetical protein
MAPVRMQNVFEEDLRIDFKRLAYLLGIPVLCGNITYVITCIDDSFEMHCFKSKVQDSLFGADCVSFIWMCHIFSLSFHECVAIERFCYAISRNQIGIDRQEPTRGQCCLLLLLALDDIIKFLELSAGCGELAVLKDVVRHLFSLSTARVMGRVCHSNSLHVAP